MTERLDQIEVRITFLERANSDLGDTVYSQQQELKALRAHLDSLLQRMESGQAQTTWTPQDEKPPHY